MDAGVKEIETQAGEARVAQRRTTQAASTMRAEGTTPVDVIVVDVSETGLRIVTAVDLEVGQEISIGLAGAGSTRAFVAWKRDGQYGCRFERPIGAEGAAMAFSNSNVVRLGATAEPRAQGEGDFLRELHARHRHWHLPADAIAAIALMGTAVAALILWL